MFTCGYEKPDGFAVSAEDLELRDVVGLGHGVLEDVVVHLELHLRGDGETQGLSFGRVLCEHTGDTG